MTPKGSFAAKLDRELKARQLGRRTLARQLSEGRGGRQTVETLRRLLRKYLSDQVVPSTATRHEIEDVLGLERDALKPDDDEEARAVVTLDDFLRVRIDELFREREQAEETPA